MKALTADDAGGTEKAAGGMESLPSQSRSAAVRMALSPADKKPESRRDFSASLIQESRDLGAYIINKRLTKKAG